MKHMTLWLVACAASLVLGCGGVPEEAASEGEALSTSSEELTVCTATCQQGTVSCPSTTTTCSATQYVGVTCDGVSIPCPTSSCSSSLPLCSDLYGKGCSGSSTVRVPCCDDATSESFCVCGSTKRYVCA
ncbi:hypothetical protein LY474_35375 [Myxococcus stipitatus]|uniref:hypothetical protein n=1 Tax=Myxococcus stipitatus TaxID=83455 RepID=UPI001F2CD2BB|nr:hypothetical protein [Myxococcus stipitatus]MCE9673102.1 hypothetical protein [Myxococcus stipitatus]